MKFNKWCIGVAVIALATVSLTATAQTSTQMSTNPPTVTVQSFPQQAIGYLSSVNTNLNWFGDDFILGVGADYENGEQWGNNIDAEYVFAESGTPNSFGVGARMRNAGIAGTVVMQEAKVDYSICYYDLRVSLALYAGYDNQFSCPVVEPELSIRKKMTANTFLGIYMSEPCLIGRSAPQASQQWVPNVGIETGCTLGNISTTGQSVALRVRAGHALTAFRHLVSPSSY